MRQLRFIVIAFVTVLFVTNAVLWRKAIAILLCGILSFNSATCYGFLNQGEIANASTARISTSSSSSRIATVPKQEQKILMSADPQSNVSLAGKWLSDWGPVEFKSDLTGYWNQGGGIGQIKDGTYDPRTRKLVFHYYQPWNEMNGTATLTLSEDGNRLSGTWTQQRGYNPQGSGGSGGWVMTRQSQRHWSLKTGVRISESMEKHIDNVANAYFLATSKNLVVTDGLRTATEQARAILNKLREDGQQAVHNLYKNKTLIDEVIVAFNKNSSSGNLSQLQAMSTTIQNQIDNGHFISLHLTGKAFDIRSRDMNNTEKSAFASAVADSGAKLINETSTAEPHYHVQF